MAPLPSCPTHQILSNGSCICELAHSTWQKGEKIECRECIKCNPLLCLARNIECNNKIPFNETVIQKCVKPTEEQYSHPDSGDLTPCRPPCSENERETQKCGCNLDRKCECEIGFYRGGPNGDCSNVCGKCFSDLQTRVPIGECLDVPSNQRCINKTPKTTSKTTYTKAAATVEDNSTPQITPQTTQQVTSPPRSKLVTTTPTVNVTLPSTTVHPTNILSPFEIFVVLTVCVTIAFFVIKYVWKKWNIYRVRETNNNDGNDNDNTNVVSEGNAMSQLLGSDNAAIVESEDGEEEVTVSNDNENLLYEIEEKILQCQCKDWAYPFCERVGEILNAKCNENRHKFFYNTFDHHYAEERYLSIKIFKDVIPHLKAYKPETFTTKDLILELSRLRGCEDAVKDICKFIRNNPG